MIETLTTEYGLTISDAGTLLSLEDGDRLDYFFDVLSRLQAFDLPEVDQAHLGRVTGNWLVTDRNFLVLTNGNQGFDGTRYPFQRSRLRLLTGQR
jgi:hypothetical protein